MNEKVLTYEAKTKTEDLDFAKCLYYFSFQKEHLYSL